MRGPNVSSQCYSLGYEHKGSAAKKNRKVVKISAIQAFQTDRWRIPTFGCM